MWIKNWWYDNGWKAPVVRFFLPVILFFIIAIIIQFNCSTENEKKFHDKQVFDSFIGLNIKNIIQTFGNNGSNVKYQNSEDYETLIYSSCNYKCEKPTEITLSTQTIKVFYYYDTIEFLINENGICYDWRAFQ